MDYSNHSDMLEQLRKGQDSDIDQREQVRDSDHFLNKKDGQWEPWIIERFRGRPRYTFDRTNPLVDQISGEIRLNDFTLRVSPSGGESSKKTAMTYDGLIRNIRNMSGADMIFDNAAESMVGTGLAGWEIVADYADPKSFDQDLLIKPIANFEDRVFFDPNYKLPTSSDADWVWVLDQITMDKYIEMWPDGTRTSISHDRIGDAYWRKADTVTIGRFMYKKPITVELVKMSDGSVYEVDEKFEQIVDDLAAQGIVEQDRRSHDTYRVHSRLADGSDWLTEEEETVFEYLPVIPCYANFRLSEGKPIYRGVAQFVMDQQRLVNFYASREAEAVALSPKPKWWMTQKQAEGFEDELRTINTDNRAVQYYNPDDEAPPPSLQGGAVLDQGLIAAKQAAENGVNQTIGLFNASLGDNRGLQSGVAINAQIGQGNTSTTKYFSAMQTAIEWTGTILVNAIPRVYDTLRTVRVIGDDGSSEMVQINSVVLDAQTGQMVELNNLSKGQYDVVCDIGPAFKNQMDEANNAFTQLVQANPNLAPIVQDLWVKNIPLPEMDKAAERLREQAINNGLVPLEQLSDEERQQVEAAQAQQGQQPDPAMIMAQGELMKGQAELQNAQNKQTELQIKAVEMQQKAQLENDKLGSQVQLNQAKTIQTQQGIEQKQQEIDLKAQSMQFEQFMKQQAMMMESIIEMQKAQDESIKTNTESLKNIKDAMGADAIMSPTTVQVYSQQTEEVLEAQSGEINDKET